MMVALQMLNNNITFLKWRQVFLQHSTLVGKLSKCKLAYLSVSPRNTIAPMSGKSLYE